MIAAPLIEEDYGYPVEGKGKMYCAMGTCCLVFCISALLWIILFRLLSKGNQFIYDIVYDIPTLGVYH